MPAVPNRAAEKDARLAQLRRFERELAIQCNRYGMENGSNTPDFILAEYLVKCLAAFDEAVNQMTSFAVVEQPFDFDTVVRTALEQAYAERKRWKGDDPVTGP